MTRFMECVLWPKYYLATTSPYMQSSNSLIDNYVCRINNLPTMFWDFKLKTRIVSMTDTVFQAWLNGNSWSDSLAHLQVFSFNFIPN